MPDAARSFGQARREAARRLEETSETAALDAELLLRETLGVDRVGLMLRDPEPIPLDADARFQELVQRRLAGEPVAYILRRKGFRTIDLYVDERVLVPRPETEEMVALALEWLARRPGSKRVVDVGTGSGAIALALAAELGKRDDVEIIATDVSRAALEVAARNRQDLSLESRVQLVHSDLLAGIDGPFDVVLANLPYLRLDQRDRSIAREPEEALFAGEDGFDLYRALFADVGRVLSRDGLVLVEIDPSQAVFGMEYAVTATGLPVMVGRDAWGRDRFLLIGNWA